MDKKSLVVQSNRLIEAKYRLSVEEQKIIKILISTIGPDDKDFQNYKFRIKDLASILGIEHKDSYGVLQKITERLISRILKFYNPETKSLLQAAWLSSAEYTEGQGIVELCFDPKLKPLLLQLKSYFTKYELEKVMRLKGQYSIRFYEFRKSFLGRKKQEVIFTLQELRETFGLKKHEYSEFHNFKNRVLEPARLELLEKTGKSFTWEPIRQGRGGKIVSIQILFDDDEPGAGSVPAMTASGPAIAPPAVNLSEPLQTILNGLLAFGIAPKTARELVENYDPDRILEAVALTEQQKDLQNKAGFLINAIRGDWHDPRLEKLKQQRQRRKEKDDLEVRKSKLTQIKSALLNYRTTIAKERYNAASDAQKQQWKNDFMTEQPVWNKLFSGKKFDIDNVMFRAFLMEKMALPTLDDYLEKENIELTDDDRALWHQLFNS